MNFNTSIALVFLCIDLCQNKPGTEIPDVTWVTLFHKSRDKQELKLIKIPVENNKTISILDLEKYFGKAYLEGGRHNNDGGSSSKNKIFANISKSKIKKLVEASESERGSEEQKKLAFENFYTKIFGIPASEITLFDKLSLYLEIVRSLLHLNSFFEKTSLLSRGGASYSDTDLLSPHSKRYKELKKRAETNFSVLSLFESEINESFRETKGLDLQQISNPKEIHKSEKKFFNRTLAFLTGFSQSENTLSNWYESLQKVKSRSIKETSLYGKRIDMVELKTVSKHIKEHLALLYYCCVMEVLKKRN